ARPHPAPAGGARREAARRAQLRSHLQAAGVHGRALQGARSDEYVQRRYRRHVAAQGLGLSPQGSATPVEASLGTVAPPLTAARVRRRTSTSKTMPRRTPPVMSWRTQLEAAALMPYRRRSC